MRALSRNKISSGIVHLGVTIVLLLIIPLLAWAIVTQRFDVRRKAATIEPPPTKEYCQSDADCGCGIDVDSGQCAIENRYYLNGICTSPDYCSGIDGKQRPVCSNGACTLGYGGGLPTPTPEATSPPTPLPTPSPRINIEPVISTNSLPNAYVRRSYTAKIEAYDLDKTDSLNMNITGLPAGLTWGPCALYATDRSYIFCNVTGTPTKKGNYSVNVSVTDGRGGVVYKILQLKVLNRFILF